MVFREFCQEVDDPNCVNHLSLWDELFSFSIAVINLHANTFWLNSQSLRKSSANNMTNWSVSVHKRTRGLGKKKQTQADRHIVRMRIRLHEKHLSQSTFGMEKIWNELRIVTFFPDFFLWILGIRILQILNQFKVFYHRYFNKWPWSSFTGEGQ